MRHALHAFHHSIRLSDYLFSDLFVHFRPRIERTSFGHLDLWSPTHRCDYPIRLFPQELCYILSAQNQPFLVMFLRRNAHAAMSPLTGQRAIDRKFLQSSRHRFLEA